MKKVTGNFLISCAIGSVAFLLYTVRDILSKDNNEDLLIEEFSSNESSNEYEDTTDENENEDEEIKDIIIIDDSDIEF